jgi:hypothetical protein
VQERELVNEQHLAHPCNTTIQYVLYYVGMPYIHCKKSVFEFPVPSWDVTDQTLSGREKFNYSRPGRVLFSDTPPGTGKSLTFFTVYKISVTNQKGGFFGFFFLNEI